MDVDRENCGCRRKKESLAPLGGNSERVDIGLVIISGCFVPDGGSGGCCWSKVCELIHSAGCVAGAVGSGFARFPAAYDRLNRLLWDARSSATSSSITHRPSAVIRSAGSFGGPGTLVLIFCRPRGPCWGTPVGCNLHYDSL
jgi:hypothetical protein